MTLISILIIVVVLPVALFMMAERFFSTQSFRNDFIRSYGGRVTGRYSWVIDINGCPVSFMYKPAGKNDPSRLEISLKGGFFAHAVLRSETEADRFAKEMGLNQEIQLFDMSFDQDIYIECEDRDFIHHLLAEGDVKKHVKDILGSMGAVHIDGNRCFAVKTPCDDLSQVHREELMRAASTMIAFSQKIPLPVSGMASATPVTEECWRRVHILAWSSGLLLAAGAVLMMWGLSAFEPLRPGRFFVASLYFSVPAAGLFVFYLFHQFKGLSVALRAFGIASILAVPGLVLLVWGGGMVINGSRDVSASVPHQVHVIDKYVTHSKNSRSYHIRVNAWAEDFSSYSFNVRSYDYQRTNMGNSCTVVTKKGFFRFEWVSSHVCYPAGR